MPELIVEPFYHYGVELSEERKQEMNLRRVALMMARVFLDRVADLTLAGNKAFPEMRLLYESDSRVRVPPLIKSYTKAGVKSVSPLGC